MERVNDSYYAYWVDFGNTEEELFSENNNRYRPVSFGVSEMNWKSVMSFNDICVIFISADSDYLTS
jgi:hypothetical protein